MEKAQKFSVGLFGVALIVLMALLGCNGDDGGTAPTITTASLQGGKVGTAYNQKLTASGDAPIIWSVSGGVLPDGLTLAAATGAMSGTPTADGTFPFTVRATNAAGSVTKLLSITIKPAVVITTSSLPDGTVGTAYSGTLAADAVVPITWSIVSESGALPAGLELDDTTGAITGTPETADTYTFTVKAENDAGEDTKELSITIRPASGTGTRDRKSVV
jgi:hypothetical protein